MKKTIVLALMALAIVAVPANAQNKQLKKEQKKEYKKKMKEFAEEDWKVFGTSRTLEVALLLHYEKRDNDGAKEITVSATSTNKNIGKERLFMSACAKYAQEMGSNIKGRLEAEMGSVFTPEELNDFDTFYAAYENEVSAEIRGELHNTFCVYKEIIHNGAPAYEFQGFFIVDAEAASKARIRAFQNAAKESEIAQKHADRISKFIAEAFAE